jgi:hypothetical protein
MKARDEVEALNGLVVIWTTSGRTQKGESNLRPDYNFSVNLVIPDRNTMKKQRTLDQSRLLKSLKSCCCSARLKIADVAMKENSHGSQAKPFASWVSQLLSSATHFGFGAENCRSPVH